MKILVIAGTRPEAIKVAPIVRELKKYPEIETVLCNSGQHKQMIEETFADFQLVPDISLDIMSPNQTLASLSAKLFTAVDQILNEYAPDWVVIQGDTTTVMVSAFCSNEKRLCKFNP